VLALVLCFAEASSHFDEPGSAYLYARHAFGSLAGFEVGWMAWLARVASVASLSVGFAQALSFVFPATAQGWGRSLAITAPLLALTAINIVGVRSGVNAAVVLVVGKLLPLGVFIAAGCFAVSWPLLAGQRPTAKATRAAVLPALRVRWLREHPAAAGEYRDPRRDVPFALLVRSASSPSWRCGRWPWAVPDLGTSAAARRRRRGFPGHLGGWLLTAGAVISILGTNGGSVLAGPRYLFALARDGFGPRVLASVHPRFRTPAAALLTQTAIALPLALSGSFVGLATLSVVARLVTYLATASAVPVLRRHHAATESFRLPGGLAIPAIAIMVSLALLANASWTNLAAAAAAALVGAVIYLLRRAAV
jgi:amino acid transporter